ncbi:MAG: 3-oxoacyl-ACP synthase III family protein [Bacteroidia bacterium]
MLRDRTFILSRYLYSMPAQIEAISYYLPDQVYTNEDFYTDFPNTKTASLHKVGVEKRHFITEGQTASDLAVLAAEKLFTEHQIDRSSIDFLLVCIIDHDYYTPQSSAIIHGRLGLKKSCGAIDYNMGCSGYTYGLGLACGILESMKPKNILLLTTSTISTTFHPNDRSSWFVFGDGSAATLLTTDDSTAGIGPFVYGTDGAAFEKIIVRDGGARHAINEDSHILQADEFGNVSSRACLQMDGVGVMLFTLKTVPAMIQELLQKSNLNLSEIDLFVFHQANVFLNETIRKKMQIPEDKFVHCMAHTGNTVASTIPIALYESEKNGRLKRGMKVLVAGFGTGLSWSATIINY